VLVLVLASRPPAAAPAELLIAALAAQFLVDFGASALRLRIVRGVSLREQLTDCWVYAIDAAFSPIALVVAEQARVNRLALLAPLPLLAILWFFSRERHKRLLGLLELNNAYRGTALVLGDVVTADDGYTGEHSRGVVQISLSVGQRLGLNAARLRNLEFGALLHDIGKIAVPKSIINKPGKLDPDEWAVIRTHTIEGQRLLDQVGGFMREVGLIVRSHHERWDGRGYPDGLSGADIPLESRIIACCDAWNAMRTDRAYRPAMSRKAAIHELREHSGSQFDPEIVEALLDVVGRPAPAAPNGPTAEPAGLASSSPV
jgi:putative nucleotidyltransferase with HDIG domain